jgi:hypothetical protein
MSGAHATGKSATIDELRKINNRKLWIDDFKVSRTVLAELGLTLEQATATAELTMDYQSKVLARKIQWDTSRKNIQAFGLNPPSYIVDRSIADVYAYTKLWCIKNNVDGEWFRKFELECINAMSLYDIIFLFPTGKFPFVDDGIRAKEETQAKIATYTEEFIVAYAKNYHVVESVSLDLRANEIITIITNGNSKTFT